MDTEATRALIGEFYDALARGDRAQVNDLLAEDVQWQMPASIPDGVLHGRERVARELGAETVKRLFTKGSFRLSIYHVWADGGVAIVQTGVHAETKAGVDYDMQYVWVYTCADGRIVHIREYLDTWRAAQSLGWDR